MNGALVVCSSPKGGEYYTGLLHDCGVEEVRTALTGAQARRLFADCDFELVVIHARLRDESGVELAELAAARTAAGVLFVARSPLVDQAAERVEQYGVIALDWPLESRVFYQAVRVASTARRRLLGLAESAPAGKRRTEEAILVERAKRALMQVLHMTEPQAHRYIEKQAMDRRITRREVASAIIEMYD